ncbi:MAG: hypothetical protein A3E01_14305 [Gammaproteobacteria bacterium RIFCSPHIGHO2_12_FULL_63_22]|nr:MAG: hypothetical protein A3E01_14305 [Gammaproteobacteria bacterium RIFCSPHIGHO2_12_FULL_63_22]
MFFVIVVSISLPACAQSPPPPSIGVKAGAQNSSSTPRKAETIIVAGTSEARARDALRKLNPQIKVDQIVAAPVVGFREAIVSGQEVYISDVGEYLLQGTLYNVQDRKDLGEASLAKVRAKLLKSIPASDRIVIASSNSRYTNWALGARRFSALQCPAVADTMAIRVARA